MLFAIFNVLIFSIIHYFVSFGELVLIIGKGEEDQLWSVWTLARA
jgi:hypothetical protein